MELTALTVRKFAEELASDSPAPGGGSVAALCGALGGALSAMVGNLTVGKEKYKDNWGAMEDAVGQGKALQEDFLTLVQEDTTAFNTYMEALKMPKESDEEKTARRAKMQQGLKEAAEVPLKTLQKCEKLVHLATVAVDKGNPNTVTDGGTAALLALAAGKAAAYNIRINLGGIKDEDFVKAMNTKVQELLQTIEKTTAQVEQKVEEAF